MQDLPVEALIRAALEARARAYAPYSRYLVGAALLCADGSVFAGCNVENAAYSVCNCAERSALFAAVSAGHRSFAAIAVAGGGADETTPLQSYAQPCGVCRQALFEFSPALTVLSARSEQDFVGHRLDELLPHAFGPQNLS